MKNGLRAGLAAAVAAGVLAASAVATVSPADAVAATPYCGIWWGSTAKTSSLLRPGPVVDVRAGRHDCFDRLVVDVAGPVTGYHVSYVDVVRADGSGHAVPLAGAGDIRVAIHAPAYDSRGNSTFRPANRSAVVNVAGWSTFRQVALVGSFEGYTTIGLGVRARLPMRVFVLPGPGSNSRVVIDVAHRW
ncbi:AMIN-like domain-containing (lipo)protein [Propionibacteriaceae bacterium Y2011]|uniref:AMIN-like domain-containing (lipo)protein n=1 Tax=Microlunatus sp. Y2014 TaxID=3418488 RepID=UPI003B4ECE90